jgi:hypothetical protein
MNNVKTLELDGIIFLCIGALVGLFMLTQVNINHRQLPVVATFPERIMKPTPTDTPTPTLVFHPVSATISEISMDGQKKVSVKTTTKQDQMIAYDVVTSNGDGTNEQKIYSNVLASHEAVTIPFNTWSPDNRYFFVEETSESGQPRVKVFAALGEAFADGSQFLNMTDIFDNYQTGNIFDEATGWAANGLIIVNTKLSDQTQGSSYWFTVPSGTFIALTTRF